MLSRRDFLKGLGSLVSLLIPKVKQESKADEFKVVNSYKKDDFVCLTSYDGRVVCSYDSGKTWNEISFGESLSDDFVPNIEFCSGVLESDLICACPDNLIYCEHFEECDKQKCPIAGVSLYGWYWYENGSVFVANDIEDFTGWIDEKWNQESESLNELAKQEQLSYEFSCENTDGLLEGEPVVARLEQVTQIEGQNECARNVYQSDVVIELEHLYVELKNNPLSGNDEYYISASKRMKDIVFGEIQSIILDGDELTIVCRDIAPECESNNYCYDNDIFILKCLNETKDSSI